jgi:ABC-2 type transport system ATP-binding protein
MVTDTRRESADNNPAIAVEELVVMRGQTRALDGITATVRRGTVTGLLGPSGSGKTTLLRCIVGAQRITAGRLNVLGMPAGAELLRARIGYVAQHLAIYLDITVRENLNYFATVLGASRANVEQVIDAVALTTEADRVVGRLSAGQQARVSLAAALLGQPELLVLDEPTVGLDPVLRRDLWQFFHKLAGMGVTLLIASHVMDEAERCTDLLILRAGRLLAAGSPAAIRGRAGVSSLEEAFLQLVDTVPAGVGGAA